MMTAEPAKKQAPYLTDPTGREHMITDAAITIGRALQNDVVITSKRVSREHARIQRDGWKMALEDLGSTNGTYLNAERLMTTVTLHDGDQIKIGDVVFTFHDPDITYRETAFPELDLDVEGGVVRVDRQVVALSPKEFALLAHLYNHSGQVRSKDEIGKAVWPEYQEGVYDYQVENLVRRLRTKLEPEAATPCLLLTVRGMGYKLITRQ